MQYADFRELKTHRLILRKMRAEDAPLYFARLGGSENVTRYMLFAPHKSMEESVRSVQKHLSRYEAGPYYHWVITEQGSDDLIGVISLLRTDAETGSCSFAYMLAQDFWGRGYGTEAVEAVFDFAFTKMEVQRIEADHMAENPASGAVMRKAGMLHTGTVPGKYEKDGIAHDAVCYCITKEQWLKKPAV